MLRVWGMRVGRGCMRDRTQLMSYMYQGHLCHRARLGTENKGCCFCCFFFFWRLTVSVLQSHFDGLLDLHFRPNR